MIMTKVTSIRSSSLGSAGIPYVVQTNDTLEGIAARYDCTPSQLLKMNKLASRLLFPGQKIYVPGTREHDSAILHQKSFDQVTASDVVGSGVSTSQNDVNKTAESTKSTGLNGSGTVRDQSKDRKEAQTESAKAADPQLDADCLQRFLKIRCKHFTDSEGVVSGVLLVTPNCVMFDPDVSHPLVIENGPDRYGMVVAMENIVSAALYKDISVLADEYGCKSNSDNQSNVTVSDDCFNKIDPTNAIQQKDDKLNKIESTEMKSTVAIGSNKKDVVMDRNTQRLSSDGSESYGKRTNLEVELSGLSLSPDMKTLLRRHASDSDRLPTDQGALNTSSGDLSVNMPQVHLATSCPSQLEAKETAQRGERNRLQSADSEKPRSSTTSRASLRTLRRSLRQRANTLGGTLVQGAQAVGSGVGTLGGTLVQGAQAVGDTLTTGAKAVVKMPQNLVNMSSGLFASPSPQHASISSSDVLDIQESWFGNDEAGNKTAEQMRKRQQNYALLARLQQKTAEARQHWMNMFSCATSKEEYPNLFAPVEDMLPYPRHLYSDLCTELPYYLCIRLDEKRRRQRVANRDSKDEYEFGNKTKTEFWFTVPRDKADTLYAFLIQWTPDLSEETGSTTAAALAQRQRLSADENLPSAVGKNAGFVVLDVNDDEMASVQESYSYQPGSLPASLNLNREWEIVTVEEVKRRLSLLDLLESEPQPLPDGSLLSALLDEQKIRCIMDVLPARAQGYPWVLVYSSEGHGFSLRTLYRNMQQWDEEVSPTLLVIKDTNNRIFGAIVNCPVRMSDHFYGSGESLLYTFYPSFTCYRWTGDNNFIVKGNTDSLSFGAGRGVYGLWLDGDLYHGRTQHCQTFDNVPLAGYEDFIVAGVEAWGFTLGTL